MQRTQLHDANASHAALQADWLPVSSAPPKLVSEGGAYSTQHFYVCCLQCSIDADTLPPSGGAIRYASASPSLIPAALGQVRTGSGNAVCIIADGIILVCRNEVCIRSRSYQQLPQDQLFTSAGFGACQDTDDLTGKLCVCICCAAVKALCINNFTVCLLGSFVKCSIGNIIAVSGEQSQ